MPSPWRKHGGARLARLRRSAAAMDRRAARCAPRRGDFQHALSTCEPLASTPSMSTTTPGGGGRIGLRPPRARPCSGARTVSRDRAASVTTRVPAAERDAHRSRQRAGAHRADIANASRHDSTKTASNAPASSIAFNTPTPRESTDTPPLHRSASRCRGLEQLLNARGPASSVSGLQAGVDEPQRPALSRE